MIKLIEMDSELPSPNIVEDFLFNELEKTTNLGYRLSILLELRKNFPREAFVFLIKQVRFQKCLDVLEHKSQYWATIGRPPSEETLMAFIGFIMGMTKEDVLRLVLDIALSKPTFHNTQIEKNNELFKREQAVRKKVYRLIKALATTEFAVKQKPMMISKQFAGMLKVAEASINS